MATQTYDLLVIGAGAAGSTAASIAASKDAHVALVERDKIGGTCLNYGCDPTKTMIHIAKLLYNAQHAERYGLRIPGVTADWPAVMEWVRHAVTRIRGGTSEEAAADLSHKDIEVIFGEGHFISDHVMQVGDRTISAERIIIATGSKNVIPTIEGLEDTGYITNREAVALPTLPRRLAIIGGGAIGMEFAQMFHRFGVEVTVLEKSPNLLDKEDREVADALCNLLAKRGLRLETNVEFQRVQKVAEGKCLTIRCGERDEEQLVVDDILLAIGRKPALESLQLDKAGVQTGKRGITVDAYLRTTVPHIWAAGDVTGGLQFTHVAYQQGKVAGQNALAQKPEPFENYVIPWVTYTDPALAHVGKTEEQLQQEGVEYHVGRMNFQDVERAIAEGETSGFVKLLVDPQGKIVGGHVLAPKAGDLLAPVVLAMQARLSAEQLANTIQPYPTMVEGVRWAADRVE
ncbi:MAG: dihydrolipoyl dehydrogenase [Ktedonobacteraceae bacterium]